MLDNPHAQYNKSPNSGNSRLELFTTSLAVQDLTCTLRRHDKETFDAWTTVANKFLELSSQVTSVEYEKLCLSGRKTFDEGSYIKSEFGVPCIKYSEIKIFDCLKNPTSDPDLDLLFTSRADLITGVVDLYNQFTSDLIDRFDNVMVVDKIVQFTQLWEGGLRLKLDLEFLKLLFLHISRAMTIPIGRNVNNFTKDLPLKVDSNKRLYFAYGSNIDREQMRFRCPNSYIAGLSTLPNFEFYINERGVASIRPALGETCHGLLWNIADEDWASLDRYEGVSQGCYRRLTIKLGEAENQFDCEIYVASNTKEGRPRFNYLEKIITAAQSSILEGILQYPQSVERDCEVYEFKRQSNYWIEELKSHRR